MWEISQWDFWKIGTRSITEMTCCLKFTDLHSSPKEMQLQKSCVSFGEECKPSWQVVASAALVYHTKEKKERAKTALFGSIHIQDLGIFNISDISGSISDIYSINLTLISLENIRRFVVNIGIIENSQILDSTLRELFPKSDSLHM